MTRSSLLLPLLLVAAAIRIALNNVVAFSRADETVYLLYARALAGGEGYPKLIRMFIITSVMTAPYAEQYQSGPPHRLILDSMAIAPLVTIVALAGLVAIALRRQTFARQARQLAALVAGILLVHAVLPSQNLRYVISADPLLRILVAAYLVPEERFPRWLGIALLFNAAVELMLFHRVFVAGQVYDPVTADVLRALHMLPH